MDVHGADGERDAGGLQRNPLPGGEVSQCGCESEVTGNRKQRCAALGHVCSSSSRDKNTEKQVENASCAEGRDPCMLVILQYKQEKTVRQTKTAADPGGSVLCTVVYYLNV